MCAVYALFKNATKKMLRFVGCVRTKFVDGGLSEQSASPPPSPPNNTSISKTNISANCALLYSNDFYFRATTLGGLFLRPNAIELLENGKKSLNQLRTIILRFMRLYIPVVWFRALQPLKDFPLETDVDVFCFKREVPEGLQRKNPSHTRPYN